MLQTVRWNNGKACLESAARGVPSSDSWYEAKARKRVYVRARWLGVVRSVPFRCKPREWVARGFACTVGSEV